MNVTYEIRTVRNTPVYAYDNETRAREELDFALMALMMLAVATVVAMGGGR